MELYLAFLAIVVGLWIIWRKKHVSTFEKLGILGPEPSLLFGNLLELYQKSPIRCHEEWVKKYGRLVGYFYGMNPVLLVADPEILKNIFIRDFQKFINRESFNPLYEYEPHHEDGQSILNLPGKKWKDVRSVLSPTFTAAKMKQMSSSMNSSLDTLTSIIEERVKSGKIFDAFDMYQRFTMDVITRTAFGVRTDIQTNVKSKLLKASKLQFSILYRDPILFIGLMFPYLRRVCRKLQGLILSILNRGIRPYKVLKRGLVKVVDYRRENPQGTKSDLLQLMLDTKIYNDAKEVDIHQLEAGVAENEAKFDKTEITDMPYRKMTHDEVVSSSITVLLAGYETTSTALAFTTYLLGKYPDVQEKLYKEINNIVQDGQKLEYATVNKLQYLDKVLNESMRVYPPVTLFANRYAMEDVQYGDLKIPKGMLVQAPVHLLHHDPEYWEEPEKFDPERFESKPNLNGITYMPFGVGPRNCLGMRFAQLEAKLALAHIIYKFKIFITDSQKDNLELIQRVRTLAPKDGIQVRMEMRDPESC